MPVIIESVMQTHRHARTPRYFLLAVLIATACGGGTGTSPSAPSTYSAGPVVAFSATDLTVTTGAQAANGDILTVTYFGWLYDEAAPENKGLLFDSTSDGFTFVLGAGQVITGWDQGLVDIRVGAKRRLVLPPSMAYGASGAGSIPGNATLLFEVVLVSIQ